MKTISVVSLMASIAIAGALPTRTWAQEGPDEAAPPPPPPAESAPAGGEQTEPEITIREEGTSTIYEYRVRGRLYMVKIKPQVGPPYYLLDTNNDGVLDVKSPVPYDNAVNQWILYQWR